MANNFITNARQRSLKNRINTLIQHSQELKFLVGFFYFSGWSELYEALRARDDLTMKILVGLDTDIYMDRILEVADPNADSSTQEELVGRFFASLRTALQDKEFDTQEFYEQVAFFLQLLENERLQIRKTFEPNHAKLYLFRLDKQGQSLIDMPGRFITGSSNLTRSGLVGQHEFNVEIGDYGWEAAEAYFDELWDTAIPISELDEHKQQIIRIIRRETQAAEVTPFEAYVLVLKTYLELMEQKTLRPQIKRLMEERGYRIFRYQEDAVQQALTVLEEYGGVILADVVGLGKSVIASWLARELDGRGLVICPPALIGDRRTRTTGWYKYLSDFGLFDWEVYSVGELDKVLDYLSQYGEDINTIVVDEAHRFRNEDTEAYERLSQICANRKVILLTATPFNNAPADIFALLKLFIPPGKSTLTLDERLAARFARYNSEFRKLSYILRYYDSDSDKRARSQRYYLEIFEQEPPIDIDLVRRRVEKLADEIRAGIEPVVIRRNRLDLNNDPVYSQEVSGLSNVADPVELFYELTPEQSMFYDEVINEYFGENGQFRGAIYQPYAYEKSSDTNESDEGSGFTLQQQRNLYEFMRRLLVKRFESSFGAFRKSLDNFIHTHDVVLDFIEKTGKYILDRTLIEKIYQEDDETIEEALQQFTAKLKEEGALNPRHDRVYIVDEFDDPDQFLSDIEADLELLRQIAERVDELGLIENDPKRACLVESVQEILGTQPAEDEPWRKVVIFSEYKDTVQYIAEELEEAFPNRVLVADKPLGKSFFDDLLSNFDASYPAKNQRNDFDILVTTDKLSEGVNLNRAGVVINYDIPWNPTRVIQRLGRINRIGHKVFDTLYICNFFPTEQGAEVVKSREIAAHKLFVIHNTLGEDAKIFAPEETPNPAELFRRINRNPEEEGESFLTTIRKEFYAIKEQYPNIVSALDNFPVRVKTAKLVDQNQVLVFRRKGLQLFIHAVPDTASQNLEVQPLLIEEALQSIKCELETPRKPLSPSFWSAYEKIKTHREQILLPRSEKSLLSKAENNLRSALAYHAAELEDLVPFIQTLLRDIKEFQTIPKYTLRRLTANEMKRKVSKAGLSRFREELERLRRCLGEDYLERIEKRVKDFRSEIIIAVENISGESTTTAP